MSDENAQGFVRKRIQGDVEVCEGDIEGQGILSDDRSTHAQHLTGEAGPINGERR